MKKSIPAPELPVSELIPNENKSKETEGEKEEGQGGENGDPLQQPPPETCEEPSPSQLPETPTFVPVFIPPLDYLTSIPDELLPSLLEPRDPKKAEELGDGAGAGSGGDSTDYGVIYNRLLESTQRTLELASRLAEVNRTLGQEEDGDDVLETATATTSEDIDPETEATEEDDDDDGNSVVSASDIVSDIAPLTSDMLADIEEDVEEEEEEEVYDDVHDENYVEGDEEREGLLEEGLTSDTRCACDLERPP